MPPFPKSNSCPIHKCNLFFVVQNTPSVDANNHRNIVFENSPGIGIISSIFLCCNLLFLEKLVPFFLVHSFFLSFNLTAFINTMEFICIVFQFALHFFGFFVVTNKATEMVSKLNCNSFVYFHFKTSTPQRKA